MKKPTKRLSHEELKKYDPLNCPVCNQLNMGLTGESIHTDGHIVTQAFTCLFCGSVWTNYYGLADVIINYRGKKK